jgi:hypothetical protein
MPMTIQMRIDAHSLVARARKKGDITPVPCEVCGSSKNVQGSHDDYAFPFEVRWLCASHHIKLHTGRRASASNRKDFLYAVKTFVLADDYLGTLDANPHNSNGNGGAK